MKIFKKSVALLMTLMLVVGLAVCSGQPEQTGSAAGYGSQNNSKAATSHAADGYINVSCGNRGKQDSITDADGNTVYTGDAPSCLMM